MEALAYDQSHFIPVAARNLKSNNSLIVKKSPLTPIPSTAPPLLLDADYCVSSYCAATLSADGHRADTCCAASAMVDCCGIACAVSAECSALVDRYGPRLLPRKVPSCTFLSLTLEKNVSFIKNERKFRNRIRSHTRISSIITVSASTGDPGSSAHPVSSMSLPRMLHAGRYSTVHHVNIDDLLKCEAEWRSFGA